MRGVEWGAVSHASFQRPTTIVIDFFLAARIRRRTLPRMFTRTPAPLDAATPPSRAVCRAIVTGLLLLVVASPAFADGPGRLVSPLIQMLAISGGMAHAQMRGGHLTMPDQPPPIAGFSIIPPRVEIPDGYEIDLVADPPHWCDPVDRSNLFSFDVLGGPQRSYTLALRYDRESREIGDGSALLRFKFEYRF